jgi:PRTRC genetic system protein E
MFRELSPLLTKRSLILTVNSVGDERIRVTITPRPTGKEETKEIIQPLAVEGTAAELDTELASTLVSYTAEHLTLTRSIEQVKASMEAALKEVKDEAAKKVADAKKGSKQPSAKPSPAEAKSEVKKPAAPSLFDSPDNAPSTTAAAGEKPAAEVPDEGDSDDSEESDEAGDQPDGPIATPSTASAATLPQTNMFDTYNEEDEILQEAFYGTQDSHVAA